MTSPAFDPAASSNALLDAQERVDRALAHRRAEQASPRGLFARFKERISDTPAAKELEAAKADFQRLRTQVIDDLPQWMHHRIQEILASAPVATRAEFAQLQDAKQAAQQRFQSAFDLRNDVRQAQESLVRAIDQCENASSAEMLDMYTRSNGVALVSYGETSDAASLVEDARQRLGLLAQQISKAKEASALIEGPDDTLDLMLDPAIDMFSRENAHALDQSAHNCWDALEMLTPLYQQLERIHTKLDAKLQGARVAFELVEHPFRSHAFRELPANLRELAPHLAPTLSATPARRRPGLR